jgi:hypothetical protein
VEVKKAAKHVCVLSCGAGEVLESSITVVNTGNLKLPAVTLIVPKLLAAKLSCKIGGTTFTNGSSVLGPKAVLTCTASHTVTTAEIEAGAVALNVAVTANSVLLVPLKREATLQLEPSQRPKLDVSITNCQPLATTMPGTATVLHHHKLLFEQERPACLGLSSCLACTAVCKLLH